MERIATNGNVVEVALAQARLTPERLALVVGEERVTYAQLAQRVVRFGNGLRARGFREGDRIALLTTPTVDFFALTMAVLAQGMAIVLVDGAMSKQRILAALRVARPRAIVSLRQVLKLWPMLTAFWGKRRFSVDGAAFGVRTLDDLLGAPEGEIAPLPRGAQDPGLVSFTSGTSGRPKGVDRTHGILLAQHLALREHFREAEGEVDMTFFPAVIMHSLCCGVGTVLPPADLRKPAEADPARVADAIRRHGVTRLWTAPAFLDKLLDHLAASGETLPGLRTLLVGGAPVYRRLCQRVGEILPHAEGVVAYGSTEAEPISSVSMREAAAARGEGLLVGLPAHVAEVELLAQAPPPSLGAEGLRPFRAADGAPGELLVRGPHVNRHYLNDPAAEARLKVQDGAGGVWHRTGDVARRDAAGNLWLLSRVDDTVVRAGKPIYPFVVEDALADSPDVARAALIAHALAPEGEVVVELRPGASATALADVRTRLDALGVGALSVHSIALIPVDLRHQSKIDRPTLRLMRETHRP